MEKEISRLDRILTHRFWGLLIFVCIIWLMFWCTFVLGGEPAQWIENLMGLLSAHVGRVMEEGWLRDFLQNGLINGVGSVLSFLPNILILFLFISVLEESGYLPRAARLMDKYMHGIGLHGSSFIPLLMGFGCNVPAIMATRSIERRNDRLLTMMMIPYIPCSARIPTFVLLVGTFFKGDTVLAMMGLYLGAILTGIAIALINKRIFFRHKSEDYEIPLPPLRVPHLRNALSGMWDAASEYLKKISTVVLVAVIIVWALDYFPLERHNAPQAQEEIPASYLERFGHTVEPVMAPLGFDWKMSAALITGIAAKEFIVGTLGVLYKDADDGNTPLGERMKNETTVTGSKALNKANALSFVIFALIYMPCVATASAIRKESGSYKWSVVTICTTLLVAWILSFAAYNAGLLIWG